MENSNGVGTLFEPVLQEVENCSTNQEVRDLTIANGPSASVTDKLCENKQQRRRLKNRPMMAS
jgi:hypothetical protein